MGLNMMNFTIKIAYLLTEICMRLQYYLVSLELNWPTTEKENLALFVKF